MGKYDKDYLAEGQRLPDLFKEIQDIRYGRAKAQELPNSKDTIKFNRIYVVDHRFNALGAILGILFVILFFSMINSNHIFAKTEDERVAIAEFEENKNVINMINVISENIDSLTKKEIATREKEIDFETKYIETALLPKDEKKVVQEGQRGKIEETLIITYENNELISENVIGEVVIQNPVEKIVEIGTSEFLAEKKVYIGDIMYTLEEIPRYEKANTSNRICYIYQHIDVKLLGEQDGWVNISIDGMEGYVKGEHLTSELVTPGIAEKARIQRININLSYDMALNTKSGFTKEDYKKVFSGNSSDTNKIFEQNAEAFYEAEQKYNINGVFLAALAIHESNWGTSNIATEKKNLFGFGSYDSSAYESSITFSNYKEGIDTVAKSLARHYLNDSGRIIYDDEIAEGTYYNGETLSGVNVRYASDPNWSTRIYNIMVSLYEKL